jgi:hypothetical protein
MVPGTTMHQTPIDDTVVAALAEEADADPRSVVRRLAGLKVRGRAGRRIDAAIAKRLQPESHAP